MIIRASTSGTLAAAIARLWSLRNLADYLAGRDWPVRVGRNRLRQIPARPRDRIPAHQDLAGVRSNSVGVRNGTVALAKHFWGMAIT
jgi:hypothetical protein